MPTDNRRDVVGDWSEELNLNEPSDELKLQRTVVDEKDLAYVRSQYRAIFAPDPKLPTPSYYDVDGRAYVPFDYEEQEAVYTRFESRARAEMERLGTKYEDNWFADAWASYWDGIYGICLKKATPEHIVRKSWLMQNISSLVDTPYADEKLERTAS